MSRHITILLLALCALGCNSHPVDKPICGTTGENVVLPTDRELCVYRHPIVIETGFTCPAQRRDFFVYEPHFGTCSDFGPPRGIERDFLVDRYAVPGRPWPVYASDAEQPPQTNQLDLLWVIDNSGSMCQEQAQLRNNFRAFVDGLAERDIDFQLGVTTTQMTDDYVLEPEAQPGVLQSRPQPIPGFDRSCHLAVDTMGEIVEGDYSPIRESIEVAVDCMAEPDMDYLDVTDADIECALYGTPQGCSIARAGCGAGQGCTAEDLFPPSDSYREIPLILESENYRVGGELDVDALTADFACASLVGTRGYGIEQGLSAAVAAVSPDNIVEGPNAGFLRDDARFAVMFVTDENDCSHDGTIDEMSGCGGDVCEFWNTEEHVGGPLTPVTELKSQLLGNLSVSKGANVTETEVFVGSIHGRAQRFSGPAATDAECGASDYSGIEPSCATSLGIAFSGDRYDRFLAQFAHHFPQAENDGSTVGWICQGDFTPALSALGEWLGTAVQ